ncbi:MAG: hypothetical protein OER21_01160 [Gemmatimonadota bacterium]|nr:hypothetical protein [Gemmatimonadota bacterium]
MRHRLLAAVLATTALAAWHAPAQAQDPRLARRLPDEVRIPIEALIDSARARALPAEPLVDRALEGAAKGAGGERIVAAVRRLAGELGVARDALGSGSTSAELVAGAAALRAGARSDDLRHLRQRRPDRPVTVAAGVLADLVAVGVPPDTAAAAVLALAGRGEDADYIAFRRNVERDVALGATPTAALTVRLTGETLSSGDAPGPTRARKP